MTETWTFAGEPMSVTAGEAAVALRRRIAEGRPETWLISSAGRLLTVVSNTERALVMLLDEEDDPGAHAVSAGSHGTSGGFRLVERAVRHLPGRGHRAARRGLPHRPAHDRYGSAAGGHGMVRGGVSGTGAGVVHRPDAVSVLASRV
ncbi:hypothetical protein [Streptomyces sp. IMTB 2501]|uniref:hypothetical protein n=1 Tax=Streptomyces sp. IMTB 2501 TaxID=1776340 RepID=UPI00211620CC|nr:hypothetical protein [Streptomyces sp. IMTB 2501]